MYFIKACEIVLEQSVDDVFVCVCVFYWGTVREIGLTAEK